LQPVAADQKNLHFICDTPILDMYERVQAVGAKARSGLNRTVWRSWTRRPHMKPRTIHLLLVSSIWVAGAIRASANDWTPLSPPDSPDARWGHSLVTLPDGNVVMFGGEAEDHRLFNDLHFFGDHWSERVPANDPPPARASHKAWAVGDQMYVYGGRGESQLFDDLWRYDSTANTWADVTPGGERPSARYAHSTAQLPEGITLIFGGNDGISDLLDFWYYNPAGNTFTELSECYLTYAHHTAHIISHFMFVFGRPNVVSAYDIDLGAWRYVPTGPPLSGRFASAVRRNRFGDDILTLYGGLDAEGVESAKVYEMNMQTGEMTERAEAMPFPWTDGALAPFPESEEPESSVRSPAADPLLTPRSGSGSNAVPFFFFGGQSGGQALDDTILFDPRFTLGYSNGPGGVVIGTTPQTVEEWDDGEEVVAQPEAGPCSRRGATAWRPPRGATRM
jgi:hypothetical protein